MTYVDGGISNHHIGPGVFLFNTVYVIDMHSASGQVAARHHTKLINKTKSPFRILKITNPPNSPWVSHLPRESNNVLDW